jgi:UDP-glucuronate decarboxylase
LYTGNLKNLENVKNNKKFKFVKHDVIVPIDFKVDKIFNFACPASPIHYQRDPVATLRTSLIGVYNLAELAIRYGADFVQASTSEVYGDPLVSPQKENYWGNVNPIGVRACYDEGKRAAETILFDYYRQYNLSIKVLRIFNTFGPRMSFDDGRVVSNFVIQSLRGRHLTIYGDGSQTRSFCYVEDLINGIIDFVNLPKSVTGPLNLGGDTELTMQALAEMVLQISGSSSHIVYLPLPSDDPKTRRPDLAQARELFRWDPKISIKKGLEKTVSDFRTRMELSIEY